MSGPLETFANAGGVHVARALLAEFSANMAKLVAEQRADAGRRTSYCAATAARRRLRHRRRAAAELSGVSLLWRAFLSWFASGKGDSMRAS